MINLNVNGVDRQFDGDPEMPLLWYLRDELGLGGTKYGCGTGLCGACTVHLDGSAVRSCLTAVSEAADAAVTTTKGQSTDGYPPAQVAWRDKNGPTGGLLQH